MTANLEACDVGMEKVAERVDGELQQASEEDADGIGEREPLESTMTLNDQPYIEKLDGQPEARSPTRNNKRKIEDDSDDNGTVKRLKPESSADAGLREEDGATADLPEEPQITENEDHGAEASGHEAMNDIRPDTLEKTTTSTGISPEPAGQPEVPSLPVPTELDTGSSEQARDSRDCKAIEPDSTMDECEATQSQQHEAGKGPSDKDNDADIDHPHAQIHHDDNQSRHTNTSTHHNDRHSYRRDASRSPSPPRRSDLPAAVKEEERRRGKRLFGGLVSTLNRSGPSASMTAQQKRRRETEERLADKAREQKRNERQLLVRREDARRRDQLEFERRVMRKRHDDMLDRARFLRTKAEPPLYWLPKRPTSSQRDIIDDQIDNAHDQIEREVAEFESRSDGRGQTRYPRNNARHGSHWRRDRPDRDRDGDVDMDQTERRGSHHHSRHGDSDGRHPADWSPWDRKTTEWDRDKRAKLHGDEDDGDYYHRSNRKRRGSEAMYKDDRRRRDDSRDQHRRDNQRGYHDDMDDNNSNNGEKMDDEEINHQDESLGNHRKDNLWEAGGRASPQSDSPDDRTHAIQATRRLKSPRDDGDVCKETRLADDEDPSPMGIAEDDSKSAGPVHRSESPRRDTNDPAAAKPASGGGDAEHVDESGDVVFEGEEDTVIY